MKKTLIEHNFPDDIRNMSPNELELLSYEIREFLLDQLSKTGGHLASNLGVVELTIALHKVFKSPYDKLIWDVGHQCYVHKLLTGRASRFATIRQLGGLSGFPKREESEHDCFNTGHSSTSISLAAGFAAARDQNHEKHSVVAIIGDGALTGGLAYEALNNLGASKSKVIIILNDNEMSISKNTGGISQHLSKLRMSRTYIDIKKQVKNTIKNIPGVGKGLYSGIGHIKDSVKYAIVNGAFFEELGFRYFGPVDGHNISDLIEIFSLAKDVEESVVIHTITQKGKGYKNAENNPNHFHGIGPFDVTTGASLSKGNGISFSNVFGNKLIHLADNDSKIIAISAAMIEGVGLAAFKERFPDRTFDVGIAEAHAVTFAAGMAQQGLKPVVAIYSTFLQRAYDQILSDVCMQKLPVVFAIDRAGIVGNDGETHHGIFDLSFLNHMPNLTILSPKDDVELEKMMEYALVLDAPCAIRYSKRELTKCPGTVCAEIETGKSECLSSGKDVEIWALGNMAETAQKTALLLQEKGIDVGFVNARFVKPLDEEGLSQSANRVSTIVTLEDNILKGGFGDEVRKFLAGQGKAKGKLLTLGWPDQFIEHGSIEELLCKYKLDPPSVAERICEFIERET